MDYSRLRQYSVSQFLTDVRSEFRFLEREYGFVEDSSQRGSHSRNVGSAEHVASTIPIVRYSARMREVTIAHDPRGAVEVIVRRYHPEFQSLGVEEIARSAGASNTAQFGEIYDMTTTTGGERVARLAQGLHEYGDPWLREPEAS